MKRFYKLVSTSHDQNGWAILLDGKPVNTLSRNKLVAPNEPLANAIVGEWARQGDEIKPDDMPLTQVLSTKIDRVFRERQAMSDTVLKYLDTDLICYRTDQPEDLKKAQEAAWDKWTAWFEDKFGVGLLTTSTLLALKHDAAAHECARTFVESLDDDAFTLLQIVVGASGSLVLGMAFVEGKISNEEIFDAARVEEHYKAKVYDEEKYGPDPAQDTKDKALQADLSAAALYLNLL